MKEVIKDYIRNDIDNFKNEGFTSIYDLAFNLVENDNTDSTWHNSRHKTKQDMGKFIGDTFFSEVVQHISIVDPSFELDFHNNRERAHSAIMVFAVATILLEIVPNFKGVLTQNIINQIIKSL